MRQIILDTETTGLHLADGHRIIEIGCIELNNRRLTGKRFHQYINPQREIEEGALAIHGITNQFLLDKPIFADIAPDLIEFISGSELIIHNAPFDVAFINNELMLANKKSQPLNKLCHIIDSLVIARQLHVGQRNSLDALCKRYGIDNTQRDLHGALLDATLLAQVYLAMTGGQSSLFDDQPLEEVTTQHSHISLPTTIERKLRTQYASKDELIAHEDQLQKILKKGKCLWLSISGKIN